MLWANSIKRIFSSAASQQVLRLLPSVGQNINPNSFSQSFSGAHGLNNKSEQRAEFSVTNQLNKIFTPEALKQMDFNGSARGELVCMSILGTINFKEKIQVTYLSGEPANQEAFVNFVCRWKASLERASNIIMADCKKGNNNKLVETLIGMSVWNAQNPVYQGMFQDETSEYFQQGLVQLLQTDPANLKLKLSSLLPWLNDADVIKIYNQAKVGLPPLWNPANSEVSFALVYCPKKIPAIKITQLFYEVSSDSEFSSPTVDVMQDPVRVLDESGCPVNIPKKKFLKKLASQGIRVFDSSNTHLTFEKSNGTRTLVPDSTFGINMFYKLDLQLEAAKALVKFYPDLNFAVLTYISDPVAKQFKEGGLTFDTIEEERKFSVCGLTYHCVLFKGVDINAYVKKGSDIRFPDE